MFVIAGVVCVILALMAFLSPQYRLISTHYDQATPVRGSYDQS